MMTKTIKNQITAINESGETDMLDLQTVRHIADREHFLDLLSYLNAEPAEYWHYIMTKDVPILDA